MQNTDAFSALHPLVNFLYFGLVLVFSMCFMHPLYLLVSLASSLTYAWYLQGAQARRFSLVYLLPLLLLTACINPAFNHRGVTILAYLPSGNPLTLESVLFGVAAAVMLVSVLEWFSCYNAVISADKFVYLFGRLIPALSLVLSMSLRLVPKFAAQWRTVREAQRCLGRDSTGGSLRHRLQCGLTVFSIMLTWALENAIETADSMRARGYGLPGRSAFSIYRWDSRDRHVLLWLAVCGSYISSGWLAGAMSWDYYPTLCGAPLTAFTASFALCYLALCLTPLLIDIKDERVWKRLRSAI